MVAIIMCVWNRIENLKKTIQSLENQTTKQFELFLWNNNSKISSEVDLIISPYNWINVHHSEINIGGIGRFCYAKELANKYETIIFIDDDQIFKNTFVQDMLNEYEPTTIKSWFGWKFNDDTYWNRKRVLDGSEVNYCGTGGMCLNSSIFLDDELFTMLPTKYSFVEDLWLSFYANHIKHWKLKSTIDVYMAIMEDGKDQYTGLKNTKVELLKYLIHNLNWKLLK